MLPPPERGQGPSLGMVTEGSGSGRRGHRLLARHLGSSEADFPKLGNTRFFQLTVFFFNSSRHSMPYWFGVVQRSG